MTCPIELSRHGVEVWVDIPDRPNYQASNMGRIRSMPREVSYICPRRGLLTAKHRGRVLKPVKAHEGGHVNVTIGVRPWLVHHLVLLTFIGPRPKGLITRHLNGNPRNNALHNICYGTASENRHDDVRHGLYDRSKGAKARNVKLTEAQVLEIRRRLLSPRRGLIAAIAREYGVTWTAISSIEKGRNWAHVRDEAA